MAQLDTPNCERPSFKHPNTHGHSLHVRTRLAPQPSNTVCTRPSAFHPNRCMQPSTTPTAACNPQPCATAACKPQSVQPLRACPPLPNSMQPPKPRCMHHPPTSCIRPPIYPAPPSHPVSPQIRRQ
eukprot:353077-Chlamydomonas_euryale.AAC.22